MHDASRTYYVSPPWRIILHTSSPPNQRYSTSAKVSVTFLSIDSIVNNIDPENVDKERLHTAAIVQSVSKPPVKVDRLGKIPDISKDFWYSIGIPLQ